MRKKVEKKINSCFLKLFFLNHEKMYKKILTGNKLEFLIILLKKIFFMKKKLEI